MENFDAAVLCSLSASSTTELRSQAVAYLAQISSQAHLYWRQLVDRLALSPHAEVHFFVIQTLDTLVQSAYSLAPGSQRLLSDGDLAALFSAIFAIARDLLSQRQYSSFVVNKCAQLLTHLCVAAYSYPFWSTFFDELYASTFGTHTPQGCSLYINVMMSIHMDIAEKGVDRSADFHRRCQEIKDVMRLKAVPQLTESLQMLMSHGETQVQHPQLITASLQLLSEFAEWIDITLLTSPSYLALLGAFLEHPFVQTDAAALMVHMVDKSMDPREKMGLLARLNIASVVERASRSFVAQYGSRESRVPEILEALDAATGTPVSPAELRLTRHEIGYYAACAKMVNKVVSGLLTTTIEEEATSFALAYLPWTFRFLLAPALDLPLRSALDISQSVFPALQAFLGRSRKMSRSNVMQSTSPPSPQTVSAQSQANMQLFAVVARIIHLCIRMPRTWVNAGVAGEPVQSSASCPALDEDDDLVQEMVEFRSQLLTHLRNVFKAAPQTLLDNFLALAWTQVTQSAHDNVEKEVFLLLFYALAEGAVERVIRAPDGVFSQLFWQVLGAQDLFLSSSPLVVIQFYEVIVRYAKYMFTLPAANGTNGPAAAPAPVPFVNQSAALANIVRGMIGPQGMYHNDPVVRTRTSYLFLRFVKDIRMFLGSELASLLPLLAPALALTPSTNTVVQSYNTHSVLWVLLNIPGQGVPRDRPLRPAEQLHVYEAVGSLVAQVALTDSSSDNSAFRALSALLQPLVSALQSPALLQDGIAGANHIGAIGALCKAFSASDGRHAALRSLCEELFRIVLGYYVSYAGPASQTAGVREKVFLFVHRMIDILGQSCKNAVVTVLQHTYRTLQVASDALILGEAMRVLLQCVMGWRVDSTSVVADMFPATLELVQATTRALGMVEDEFFNLLSLSLPSQAPPSVAASPVAASGSGLSSLSAAAAQAATSAAASMPSSELNAVLHSETVRMLLEVYRQFFVLLYTMAGNGMTPYLLSAALPDAHVNAVFSLLRLGMTCLLEPHVARTVVGCTVNMVSAADASRDIRFSAWSTWVAEQLLPIALRIPVLSAFDVRDAECSRLLKEVVALLRTCVLRYGTSIVDYILKCVSGVWGVDVSHPSLMEDAVSLQNALIQGQQLEAETAMRKLVEKVRLPQSGRV